MAQNSKHNLAVPARTPHLLNRVAQRCVACGVGLSQLCARGDGCVRRELPVSVQRCARDAGVHRTSFELLQRRAAASCETLHALRGLAAGGLLLRERELRRQKTGCQSPC